MIVVALNVGYCRKTSSHFEHKQPGELLQSAPLCSCFVNSCIWHSSYDRFKLFILQD